MKRSLLLAFLALSFLLFARVLLPQQKVFTVEGVNLQESDAWYHFRLAEAFSAHWPSVPAEDYHASFPGPQKVDVGPIFDLGQVLFWRLLPGLPRQTLSVFYPVVLGALAAMFCWLAARRLWGQSAAWWTLAFLLTLPGAATRVSSLGFTDHHVLEMLLYAALFWALAAERRWFAGLFLGLYLITFVGGAVLVAMLIGWRLFEPQIRSLWPSYCLALLLVLPCRGQLWMDYSIAMLAAALGLELLFLFVRKPRLRWAIVFCGVLLGIWAAWRFGVFHLAMHFGAGIGSRTVGEMQPMTLRSTWAEYGGLYLLGLAGLWRLWREDLPAGRWVAFSGCAFAAMAVFQTRLNYYVGINLALLGGAAWAQRWHSFSSFRQRAIAAPLLAAFVIMPNLYGLWQQSQVNTGLRADFYPVLHWMRENTPDPFGDPNLYTQLGTRPSQPGYGVLAWWDYGYALTAIAHRIPFTNPTQKNAAPAASMLLANSGEALLSGMRQSGLRYLLLSDDLPMMPIQGGAAGRFGRIAAWAGRERSEFYEVVWIEDPSGSRYLVTLYYPAYFQTALIHLTLFGGKAVEAPTRSTVAVRLGARSPEGYRTVEWKGKADQAASQNAQIVSVSPLDSCVALEAIPGLRLVQDSGLSSALTSAGKMSSVQLYELSPTEEFKSGNARPTTKPRLH